MSITQIIIGLMVGIAAGFGLALVFIRKSIERKSQNILQNANDDAELIKKNKIIEAKEKFLELKKEHEEHISAQSQKLKDSENRIRTETEEIKRGKDNLSRKEEDVNRLNQQLSRQLELINTKKADLEKLNRQRIEQLEKIANVSAKDARDQLTEALKDEAKTQAMSYIKDIQEEAQINANKEAKKIVLQTIQRVATEHSIENAVSVFNIASDEIKGRIIGREGRNIRALEAATGVEINVDDTPEAIILSCFDPIRREIARLSLHQLVTDGRIHPARIEEVVSKTKKQIEEEIVEIGKRTCIDLGIHGLHGELTRIVGRMKYRSSYGQNLLQHSREVANLCATMASELGFSEKMVKMAKRAGLLHDIGKVPDDEPELPHAILGMKIAEKHKEHPDVCNAIGAHHDEVEMKTLIAPLVQVCDAISGARPGARREILESYVRRIEELEALALGYEGVEKVFALQAGREIRVMVESDKVNDDEAGDLSFQISQKIQDDMTYPGQVKVTVIRETRATNYAK